MDFDDVLASTDVAEFAGAPARERDLRSRGLETVRALLSAGHEAVVEFGHDGFRIDDVVDGAGVAHGTFYIYFRDRQDLLRSLVRVVARQLRPLGNQLQGAPCLLYTSPSPRDVEESRMPSSA